LNHFILEFRVYHSIVHEPFKSFLIGLRVRTFGISGGETLNFMLCVEGSYRAVDPIPETYKRIRIAYIEAARSRPEEFGKRLNHFICKTKENKTIRGFGGIEKYYSK